EQLRRPVLPSRWSCLGMVKHLALGVEHYWLRCIVAGESLDFYTMNSLDNNRDWDVGPKETGEEVFNLYRDEIQRGNAIITETPLDTPPAQRDDWWGNWQIPDLEYIVLHMITETACHAGHLDAARELLDGRQWSTE
ncbi:MAG TPA: DinB family protein, partial [Acidimicrobiales bacterium]|nr:DinB family protein [Acidimicrobiales bacterium]